MTKTRSSVLVLVSLIASKLLVPEAHACACAVPADPVFLHTFAQDKSPPRVHLPSNAKGALIHFAGWHLGTIRTDRRKNRILAALPRPPDVSNFTIVEGATGKRLHPLLTPLSAVHAQLYDAGQYYLAPNPARLPRASKYDKDHVLTLAAKLGLKNITAQARNAFGLFRIGPQNGFENGKRYLITYTPDGGHPDSINVEVTVGPPVALSSSGEFALSTVGTPYRANSKLPRPAPCSFGVPAIMQELRYSVPAAYEPYRASISFYTLQKYGQRDRPNSLVEANAFVRAAAPRFSCSEPIEGGSQYGPLKDVVWTERRLARGEPRYVKAYVGMLEVEDKLHETQTLMITFDKATGPQCEALNTDPPHP